jgi:hypothetical protein
MQAETAARELGRLGLLDALDYLVLLAAEAPERFDRAAQRWLARLLSESALTPDEVAVASGCVRGFCGRLRGAVAGDAPGAGEAPA